MSPRKLELASVTDIAKIAEVSRVRANQLVRWQGDDDVPPFPKPVDPRPRGRRWRRKEVEAWVAVWAPQRRGRLGMGRPHKL